MQKLQPHDMSLKQRITVLHLSPEYPPQSLGGLGTHVAGLVKGLGVLGCQTMVMAPSGDFEQTKVQRHENLETHLLSIKTLHTNFRQLNDRASDKGIVALNELLVQYGRQLLRTGKIPDLIHCHDWLTFPAAHALCQEFQLPLIATLHLLIDPISSWLGRRPSEAALQYERQLCSVAKGIITVSHSMSQIIEETYAVPRQRIQVVYNGIDAGIFQRAMKPELLPKLRQTIAPNGEQIILFAGRLDAQKGISALFAAAERVLAEYPRVCYVLAGATATQEHETMLHELAQQYPLAQQHIKRLGYVPRSQLAQLYQIADLALVPSIYEPFGYAAVEAMAAGVPVIASRVGGLAEIIEHGQTGWLVPVATPPSEPHQVDIDALATAQLHLLRDRALAQRLAQAARSRVTQHFTLSTMAEATLEVYRKVLASTNHASRYAPVTLAGLPANATGGP